MRRQLKRLLLRFYSYENQGTDPKKINIALIIRDGTSHPKSSAFIRLLSPLTDASVANKVSIKILDENTTLLQGGTSICIVQRTAFDNRDLAKQLVSQLEETGTKLIVDSDDAFNLLDTSHVEHSIHNDRYEALEYLIQKASQVWVSTHALAVLHKKDKSNIYVVPNSLDDRLWGRTNDSMDQEITNGSTIRIVYMGTATHEADFNMILPSLDKLAQKYPDSFELTVIGVSPGELPKRKWIKRLRQPRGGSIYPKFVGWFIKQGPFDIGLCPLLESPFNNCKSDIKCLDYLAAGILPIASDVPAYRTPELDEFIIKISNNPDAWERSLEIIIKDVKSFKMQKSKIVSDAQKYLWSQRSSKNTAKDLLNYIALVNKS